MSNTITGSCGIVGAGANIGYSGTATGAVVADSSGNFTISGLAAGTYSISAWKLSYTFSPLVSSQTIVSSNITGVNFVATFQSNNLDTNAWYVPEGQFGPTSLIGLTGAQIDVNQGGNSLLQLHAVWNDNPPTSWGAPTENSTAFNLSGGTVWWRKLNFLYGTAECRAKLMGLGTHTTFWMFAKVFFYQQPNPNPNASNQSEIDIAEAVPFIYSDTTTLRQNAGTSGTLTSDTTTVTDYSTNFHVYKMVWTPTACTFFVDGVQTNQITGTPGSTIPKIPMYVLMDIEQDAAGAGPPVKGNFPQVFQIDYVKVWDQSNNLIFYDEFDGTPAQTNQMIKIVSSSFPTIEDPLSDGGVFTTVADAVWTSTIKVPSAGLAEPHVAGSNCASFYSGPVPIGDTGGTWPNDQYSEVTLAQIAGGATYCLVRQGAAASGTQYYMGISSAGYGLGAIVSGTNHSLLASPQTPLSAVAIGDIWRLSITGNVLSIFQNGQLVTTFTDTNNYIASGKPGMGISSAVTIANEQISFWAAGANQAVTPVFSPPGGTYIGAQTVTITGQTSSTIYYTTDGSTPTRSSSSIASGATVNIASSSTLNAISSKTNFVDSEILSAGYIISASASISGSAGVAGATVSYTGTSSGSVVADSSGNYTISGLSSGSYTLTPSFPGYSFSPKSSVQTISGSNITGVNFIVSAIATPVGCNYPGAYPGATLALAFQNPQQMDLIQVINEGGKIVWNLDYLGNANVNPTSSTSNSYLGRWEGQSFATAFPNANQLNIFQVIGSGGHIVFFVDYLGNASTN